MRNSNYQVPFG